MERLGVFLLWATVGCHAVAPQLQPTRLGEAPLCEASAARFAPCTRNGDESCVLVGDNEQKHEIFEFHVDPRGRLIDQAAIDVDASIGDLEALELLGDRLLLMGSHGRKAWKNKSQECAVDADRNRFAILRRGPKSSGVSVQTDEGERTKLLGVDCITRLFHAADPLVTTVCGRFSETERAATGAVEPIRCDETFNIEGLAAMPAAGHPSRVWVGLRSPLLEGKALLLRLDQELDTFAFDAVATIDLGGMGVRELAFSDGWLYGIAGPTADSAELRFRLWRTRATNVQPSHRIERGDIEILRGDLPPSSEGLAVDGTRAVIIVDGKEGPRGQDCETPAGQVTITLPH